MAATKNRGIKELVKEITSVFRMEAAFLSSFLLMLFVSFLGGAIAYRLALAAGF